LKDELDGMKTQLTSNTMTLSIVSTNVVQLEIDGKSILLKQKDEGVDDSQDNELTALGVALCALDKLDDYGIDLMEFVVPSYAHADSSPAFQNLFQDGQDLLESQDHKMLSSSRPSYAYRVVSLSLLPLVHYDKKKKKKKRRGCES
jgi:hypothetical protein